jgi:hypothetical protein
MTAEYFQPATATSGHLSGGFVPNLPDATYSATAVTLGSRIFLVGGITVGGARNTIASFDVEAGSWTIHAPLPPPMHLEFVGAFASGGVLHVLSYDRLATWDADTDQWTVRSIPFIPTLGGEAFPSYPYEDFCTTWDGARFHTMVNRHPVTFDPATSTWTSGTQASHFCNGAFGVLNGELHFGGSGERPGDTRVFMAYRP